MRKFTEVSLTKQHSTSLFFLPLTHVFPAMNITFFVALITRYFNYLLGLAPTLPPRKLKGTNAIPQERNLRQLGDNLLSS